MSIEAMKQALEALQYVYEGANNQGPHTGISWRCVSNKTEPVITSLRQAIAEFDSHTLYREGYVNGYAFGEAAGKRQAIAEAEKQEPKREPLTDEQIGEIAIKSQDGISPHDDTLRFARAIEAAHGIKGEA